MFVRMTPTHLCVVLQGHVVASRAETDAHQAAIGDYASAGLRLASDAPEAVDAIYHWTEVVISESVLQGENYTATYQIRGCSVY
jgi:hypothetical protein